MKKGAWWGKEKWGKVADEEYKHPASLLSVCESLSWILSWHEIRMFKETIITTEGGGTAFDKPMYSKTLRKE